MKPGTIPSDTDLLQSVLTGDEDALSELYRRRYEGIYRFALHMCGSRSIAEDVTQEVFMVLIRESHRFESDRGSLSAFLFGIARNQLFRRLRREQFYVTMGDDACDSIDGVEQPFESIFRSEVIDSVRRAVLALPERYREVVVLCELEELSYAEAAEVLGCAIGTVRSRLHRARGLLIEKLRPAAPDQSSAPAVKSARCFA